MLPPAFDQNLDRWIERKVTPHLPRGRALRLALALLLLLVACALRCAADAAAARTP
jgi:hypothetical protein